MIKVNKLKSKNPFLKVQFLNWVCVESNAVGKAQVSIPKAEIIGIATVSEHLPKQEISWIAATLFCIIKLPSIEIWRYTVYNNFDIIKAE